ncbi:preprotein translocase subunit SecE [Helicobacter trogontum]|uniref:Protein translocase subunit SecE n=1 Tax=Helicobacter trogontum TaxID=50960 RepID=A0A099VL26_9HELI|nr:preprotein translocase subunit SecE [Helicobacter trogontum]MCI5786739.1 preprotein translocase subunit SecE [Helicobacter trogontum]MDY5185949.1 preprotein translocase subunit SecE [Helicobacter trogontum]TLD84965.1 preprotein translocase subunit SecE [Helicobacter trogontum]TLD98768.1 preprotein translocase subunit SecE [Helicobacter trogontum]
MVKIKKYYKESKDELGKVIFPTKEQVRTAFVSVVVVVSIIALFLAVIDVFFHYTISRIVS